MICRRIEKISLGNGVEVFLVNMGTLDTLMMNVVFYAGNCFEEREPGCFRHQFLLKNGTRSKTAFEINEYFEYYGAYLSRHAGHETAELTLHCMNKHVSELLPAVAELISDSIFPEEELRIYKKNMQQRLQVNLRKNDFVASRLIDAYLFGEKHPYGRYSTASDYEALQVDQLRSFYDDYYRQGRCMIFVAGLLPADMNAQIEKHFGTLPFGGSSRQLIPAMPVQPAGQKKYRLINDPDGVQGAIRIARNFPNRHHPDFQKMLVLNNLFGGFFGSRLMANIREDKGYTYGIHSYLTNLIQESSLMISTEAGKEVSEDTLKEVYIEMKRLCDEPVARRRIADNKKFYDRHFIG